jgi:thymidylate synthase (FAD)
MNTKRSTVPAIEEILGHEFKILDHGFIRVVDYMGDDNAIVQAARVSYGKGTKQVNEDRGLIRYLLRHKHTTPFEMCEIKLHVKLPIFVARQWVRHRTANINEYSARYSLMESDFYLPSVDNIASQSQDNKQCRGGDIEQKEKARALDILENDPKICYQHYLEMLNLDSEQGSVADESKQGIARELARLNLPVSFYTQWYWKIDLHNLMHFVKLRADPHAQYEIRVYAEKIAEIMKLWVPHTYEAFCDYILNAASFSAQALEVLRRMLKGEQITQESSALSKREWSDVINVLNISEESNYARKHG